MLFKLQKCVKLKWTEEIGKLYNLNASQLKTGRKKKMFKIN